MKKINNKAFTLIELMVVISLLAIIIAFSLPNISSTLERNKKDQMINDAKDMVEKAKNYIFRGNECTSSNECTLELIDTKTEIKTSPFGKWYNRNSSYVTRKNVGKSYEYYVYLTDENMCIGEVNISVLNGANKYNSVKSCSK